MTQSTRAGFVALIGLPNTGKSSLLNQFLGTKLSIVTPLAQTTRERVVGIDTRSDVQLIFLDTPGIIDPAYLLHQAMAGIVEEAMAGADVIVLLLDGTRAPPVLSEEVITTLRAAGPRLLVTINKRDVAAETQIRELTEWARFRLGATATAISAATGEGVEELRERIAELLPESPFLFPGDEISTQSVRFFVAEMVRESVFELFHEEIPYSVATKVEEFHEGRDPVVIRVTVFVERQIGRAHV